MQNTNQLKTEIVSIVDLLPEDGIKLLYEFVAFLKLKFNLHNQIDLETAPTRAYGIPKAEFVGPDNRDASLPEDILDIFDRR